jgi:secreted PhoX family phosphatase
MKKTLLSASLLLTLASAKAQLGFNPHFDFSIQSDTVVTPASGLIKQVLFIGGVDMVQTTDTYGNPAGEFPAKQWHDFIGFTPDPQSNDLGWLSVNHEMVVADDNIGDGGGMTVFKVKRDPATDSLIIVNQTLPDGRSGQFFNVDFANTVGETGMNCGGIQSSFDGRIWTAEEWFRNSTNDIYANGSGVRDTALFTITGSGIDAADGQTIQKFENFNYMVEIDPKTATAIRKQYNWGRQPFEGGVVMPDNKTVYLGADNTPGIFTKFIADIAGDFTSGTTYYYKEDAPGKWVEIDNGDLNTMLHFQDEAIAGGATMFNRLEWIAYSPKDGNVYMTETGRDNPAGSWADEYADGGQFAKHHIARANAQYVSGPNDGDYRDYYGRVLKLDVATNEVSVFIEGGPEYAANVDPSEYPSTHLSNPDGLGFIVIGDKSYMLICEDLNGSSNGRMPMGYSNKTCELFMLDMTIANPGLNDLIRIAEVPMGAEVTGVRGTPDGKTILFNVQHPSSSNPYPYNNSCTIALTGFDKGFLSTPEIDRTTSELKLYPNPAISVVHLNKITDVGVYDANGNLIQVLRNTDTINVSGFVPGTYFIQTSENETKTLIVQ